MELDELISQISMEDIESKKYRLQSTFNRSIREKIALVPKTGKGSFNVTVPVPFDGMEAEKKVSTQDIKFREMMAEKARAEERELGVKYKAKPIPAHVKSNKFEKLMREQEDRREEAKRLAIAKIKATEAPFNFYQRDVEIAKRK